MSIKSFVLYIAVMLLIALTLFNFYALITARKRKSTAKGSYHFEMDAIESKLLRLMKERGLNFSIVRRFMNDRGDGIIFVSDPENRKAAIAMKDDIELFSFEDLEDAGKEYLKNEKDKTLGSRVYAVISGTRIEYTIGSKPFNPRGLMGKVIYETTEEFFKELETILKAK